MSPEVERPQLQTASMVAEIVHIHLEDEGGGGKYIVSYRYL